MRTRPKSFKFLAMMIVVAVVAGVFPAAAMADGHGAAPVAAPTGQASAYQEGFGQILGFGDPDTGIFWATLDPREGTTGTLTLPPSAGNVTRMAATDFFWGTTDIWGRWNFIITNRAVRAEGAELVVTFTAEYRYIDGWDWAGARPPEGPVNYTVRVRTDNTLTQTRTLTVPAVSIRANGITATINPTLTTELYPGQEVRVYTQFAGEVRRDAVLLHGLDDGTGQQLDTFDVVGGDNPYETWRPEWHYEYFTMPAGEGDLTANLVFGIVSFSNL